MLSDHTGQKEGCMKNYKVNLPEDYKERFTLADMENIKAIDKETLHENITCLLDVLTGGDELLKYELTWVRTPEGFFDGGIDIEFHVILYSFSEVREVWMTGSQINCICSVDDKHSFGYQRVFKKVD